MSDDSVYVFEKNIKRIPFPCDYLYSYDYRNPTIETDLENLEVIKIVNHHTPLGWMDIFFIDEDNKQRIISVPWDKQMLFLKYHGNFFARKLYEE